MDAEERRRLLSLPRPSEGRIDGLFGEYRPLSNFAIALFVLDGYLFQSVEHAYQAFKAPPGSPDFVRIMEADTPKAAKALSKILHALGKVPDLWHDEKVRLMSRCVLARFTCDRRGADLLLSTGDLYIEETNWWNDRFWGVYRGQGENMMGRILMRVRTVLRDMETW